MKRSSGEIPKSFLEKWQSIADLLAKLLKIPAALIMMADNEYMEVVVSSKAENNPYHPGDKEHQNGLYCETVVKTQKALLVPNALKDKKWDKNPDINLGMIAYMGIPVNFPDNQPFGTLCVLDTKENKFSKEHLELLYQFKYAIELDLALMHSLNWKKDHDDHGVIQNLLKQNEEFKAVNEKLILAYGQLSAEKEKALETEMHFSLLVDNAPDAIFIQTEWKFAYINKKGLELFGAESPEQLLGTNVMDRFHPDFHEKVTQRIIGLNKEKQIQPLFEQVYLKLDGTPVHVESSAIPYKYQQKDGALVFVRDITARKEADAKLHHRHSLLDYIVKHNPNGIAVFDNNLRYIYVSQKFLSDYNIDSQDIIGKHHYEVFPEVPDKWKKAHQRALKGEVVRKDEDIFVRKDGTVEYTRYECRPWWYNDDAIGGIVIYTEQITQRKQTEKQLTDSEEKFRRAFYTSPESLTIARLDNGVFISVNNGFTRMLEYSESEVIGKTELDLNIWCSEKERTHFVKAFKRKGLIENYEATFKSKSGKIINCLISASSIIIDETPHMLSIARDITERKILEGSAVQAYELIKNLAAQVPGVIYQYRLYPDGRSAFPFSSEGMYDIYEVTSEEVKEDASPVFSRLHPDDYNYIAEGIIESAKNQSIYNSKFRVVLPKQGLRWRFCNAVPQLLEDGSTLWHGIIMDITEEKIKEDLLKEKSEEISTFFDCALDLMCIADARGNFLRLNKEWENVLGYPISELEGNRSLNYVHPDDAKPTMEALNQLYNNQAIVNFTNRYLTKNGGYKWIEWKATPVGNRIYAAARDITDKILINEELVNAKEKAEESNRLKIEFLNNMSHEIRTPMNGIIGFAELLNKADLPDEKRKYFSKIIQNSAQQLLRIIDDILEISTLETKQNTVNEEVLCLNDLMMDIFSIFSLKSKERNIPIFFKKGLHDSQCQIISDKTKLTKILDNLLENALKFTVEGFIEMGYYVDGQDLVLYVKDTGIGIAPENHKIVFERFSQEDKEISRKQGGLGLGLSISKENALLLGGDITLESEKGKGSTFFVTIPYKTIQDPVVGMSGDPDNPVVTFDKKKYTVLVAEDEEINYMFIETLFEQESEYEFNIIHAKNGQEAVDLCQEAKEIDLILMDIKMPVMNGHEATEIIKSKFPDLPIIAQTAYSTEEDKKQAIKFGCDDFISKPLNVEKLFGMINKYLKIS